MSKVKRYSLGIKVCNESRSFSKYSINELNILIKKYNDNPKNKYFLGDIYVDYNNKCIIFSKYLKVSEPSYLEDIDKYTTKYINENELRSFYNISIRNRHKLVILYRSNKKIKSLPILYSKDKEYFNNKYFLNKLHTLGKDIDFIRNILSNKDIMSSVRDSIDEYDLLRCLRDRLKYTESSLVSVDPLIEFYNKFIHEKGKFNYYNYRLFINLVKEYSKDSTKKEEREEVVNQIGIDDILLSGIRSEYEELKLNLMD